MCIRDRSLRGVSSCITLLIWSVRLTEPPVQVGPPTNALFITQSRPPAATVVVDLPSSSHEADEEILCAKDLHGASYMIIESLSACWALLECMPTIGMLSN